MELTVGVRCFTCTIAIIVEITAAVDVIMYTGAGSSGTGWELQLFESERAGIPAV